MVGRLCKLRIVSQTVDLGNGEKDFFEALSTGMARNPTAPMA
jgi:hypothetical protein